MPPPPPPGAMLMQDREYGALGLAKIRVVKSDTPETIAAEEEVKAWKASWHGGWCPSSGHKYYHAGNGNTLTFQWDDEGIEQLLRDSWPDALLAIQPVLAQVNELTSDAWYWRTEVCCGCTNYYIELRGASHVHQLLTASSWIIKLNEVLNPHGLAADLYEKSTFRIHTREIRLTHKHGGIVHEDGTRTEYYAETDIDLYLRLFLWSARAVQSAPQPILPQPMEVPPGAAGGYWITVVGPDGQQYQTIVPPGPMPAQFFAFHVPARAAMAPPPQTMQLVVPSGVVPGQTIAAQLPDGRQCTSRHTWRDLGFRAFGIKGGPVRDNDCRVGVRVGGYDVGIKGVPVPDGAQHRLGPGQGFLLELPRDAAWWRTVEPPEASPAQQVAVRPVFALYLQPRLAHWSVGYARPFGSTEADNLEMET